MLLKFFLLRYLSSWSLLIHSILQLYLTRSKLSCSSANLSWWWAHITWYLINIAFYTGTSLLLLRLNIISAKLWATLNRLSWRNFAWLCLSLRRNHTFEFLKHIVIISCKFLMNQPNRFGELCYKLGRSSSIYSKWRYNSFRRENWII